MPIQRLTVLTQPVPEASPEALLKMAQRVLLRVRGRPQGRYTGHSAVTRSLVEGLRKIGARFNYNPNSRDDVGDVVHVPGGHLALRQAIRWRRQGRIRRLLAGPNLVISPSDRPRLVGSPYIDRCLVPGDWVRIYYERDLPTLAGRCRAWPAGVDLSWWQPAEASRHPRSLLFYDKRPPPGLYAECLRLATVFDFTVQELHYGSYSPEEYRDALHRNAFLVHFVEQEAQGISLAEAWATDTPSLVWNPGYCQLKGRNLDASSSPYLNARNGRFFAHAGEFRQLLQELRDLTPNFSARGWVEENMSDEACARHLWALAEEIA